MSKIQKTALVLTGGGAYAAYEVGVLKALFNGDSPATKGQPLEPDYIVASSFGSINAGILAAHDGDGLPKAVEKLEKIWRTRIARSGDTCGNGVFRIRGGASELLDPNCYSSNPFSLFRTALSDAGWAARETASLTSDPAQLLHPLEKFDLRTFIDTEPLKALLKECIPVSGLKKSRQDLQINALNIQRGIINVFDREELARIGYSAFLAAVSFPFFLPPVEVDGKPCIDAFLLMNRSLLESARDADKIHVIYSDPTLESIERSRLDSTLDIFVQAATVMQANSLNGQIDRIGRINEAIDLVEAGKPDSDDDSGILAFLENAAWIQDQIKTNNCLPRKRTVHRFHPEEELGGPLGFLNFESDQIDRLIKKGYEDTKNFDMAASRSVMAD